MTKINYALNFLQLGCVFIAINSASAASVEYDVPGADQMFKIFFGSDVESRFLKSGTCSLTKLYSDDKEGKYPGMYNLAMEMDGKPYMPFCSILFDIVSEEAQKKNGIDLTLYKYKTDWKASVKALFKGELFVKSAGFFSPDSIHLDMKDKLVDKKTVKINSAFLHSHSAEILPVFDKCVDWKKKVTYPQISKDEINEFENARKYIAGSYMKDSVKKSIKVMSEISEIRKNEEDKILNQPRSKIKDTIEPTINGNASSNSSAVAK